MELCEIVVFFKPHQNGVFRTKNDCPQLPRHFSRHPRSAGCAQWALKAKPNSSRMKRRSARWPGFPNHRDTLALAGRLGISGNLHVFVFFGLKKIGLMEYTPRYMEYPPGILWYMGLSSDICFKITRPGTVNVQKTMERSSMFNGKIHYFEWAIFNSYVSHYQRVMEYTHRYMEYPLGIPWYMGWNMVCRWMDYHPRIRFVGQKKTFF